MELPPPPPPPAVMELLPMIRPPQVPALPAAPPRTSKVWLEQFLLLGILFYLHQMKAHIHNDMVHFYARYPWHIFGLRYEECLIPGIRFFINEIGNEVAGYSGVLSYMRNNVKHQPNFDRLV